MGVLNNSMWNVASGASGFYDHQIASSLRNSQAQDGTLKITAGTPTSSKTFTYSWWWKRYDTISDATQSTNVFTTGTGGGTYVFFTFTNSSVMQANFNFTGGNFVDSRLTTNMQFRDTSAWYHCVLRFDSTQATASNRVRLYVNGVEPTYSSASVQTDISQDEDISFMNQDGVVQAWGGLTGKGTGAEGADVQMAEIVFNDGQSYGPDSYGETKNGVWIPKDPSGLTFGNNGYYLKMLAGAIGDDSSGNGNDFTAANFAAHDVLLDSPTFGSAGSANFPAFSNIYKTQSTNITDGNLDFRSTGNVEGGLTTAVIPAGESTVYYFEAAVTPATGGHEVYWGVNALNIDMSGSSERGGRDEATCWAILLQPSGHQYLQAGSFDGRSEVSLTINTGDIIGMVIDRANTTIKWYINNVLKITSTNLIATGDLAVWSGKGGGTTDCGIILNAGQDGTFCGTKTAQGNADSNGFGNFFYSPPLGVAYCSGNLPIATEVDPAQDVSPNQFFDTVIYTGDGGTNTSITTLNFQPDWLLIKNRDVTDGWLNQNSVSGVGVTHEWNDDGPYESETDCIKSFNSNGWTMSNDHKVNANTEKYVAYGWKKSADAGFDIVEYSGNGSANAVSHSLGAAPDCIMMHLKSGSDWDSTMYFNSPNMGVGKGVFITLANAAQATQYMTATSSTTFTPTSSANSDGRVYVAYLFRSIDGYSKFGEFEGNADADGPVVYTGFRPKFVWFKAIDQAENWQIRDTARNPRNIGSALRIYWNTNSANASASTASPIDFLANGFKVRGSNTEINSNTIIYGAVADVPSKYANTL